MKRSLSALVLSLILASALALPACSSETEATKEAEPAKAEQPKEIDPLIAGETKKEVAANVNLNEQNRVQNEGDFLVDGDWYYGQSWNESDGSPTFVKARKDMSDWTVIDDGYANQIYVIDGYIYYMLNSKNNYGIYRAKASGQGEKRLVKAYGTMQIVGDKIYYSNYMINGKYNADGKTKKKDAYSLYRCDLDGKNVEKIIDKQVFHPYVFDKGILYQDDDDNMSLHICDLDGKNDVKINDDRSFFPIYDGKSIYYVKEKKNKNGKYQRSIWKVNPDGTEDKLVSECKATNALLLTEDRIYFVNGGDGDRLYRMDKDGSNLELVTQSPRITEVVFLEDGLKYVKCTKGYEYSDGLYICNFDGSGKWEFTKN